MRPNAGFASACRFWFRVLMVASAILLAITSWNTNLLGQTRAHEAVDIPTPADIQDLPLRPHPRLILTDERIRLLRRQIGTNPHLTAWYQDIKARADSLVASRETEEYRIPDGRRLIYVTSKIRDRVHTLALVAQIEQEKRYAERVWTELKAAGTFPDWNPSHFLDTAEMTQSFAIAYDWLYHFWTEDQRRYLRDTMIEMGLKVALAEYREGSAHWTRALYNWGQVTNGGIGLGALAVLDDRPELASTILVEALSRIPKVMQHYIPDGGWIEGPGYWDFGTRYNVYIVSALQTALGADFGFTTVPGFSETGYYPIYITSPNGKAFNHGDANASSTGGPQLFWLADQFDKPAFARHQIRIPDAHPVGTVWLNEKVQQLADQEVSLPLDRYFKSAEIATFRSAWNDSSAFFAGIKGGHNGASHAHLDQGTFVLDALGVRWATELGADRYSLPGYFAMDTQRWTYYRTRTEGQNTLAIAPDNTPAQKIESWGHITRFGTTPDRSFAVVDITHAYSDHAETVQRGLQLYDNRRRILVQDEITNHESADVWWFMHTKTSISLAGDPQTATLIKDDRRLQVRILEPSSAEFSIQLARPFSGSPDPPSQAKNRGVRKLTIHVPDVSQTRIVVAFAPYRASEPAPPVSAEITPLKEW